MYREHKNVLWLGGYIVPLVTHRARGRQLM